MRLSLFILAAFLAQFMAMDSAQAKKGHGEAPPSFPPPPKIERKPFDLSQVRKAQQEHAKAPRPKLTPPKLLDLKPPPKAAHTSFPASKPILKKLDKNAGPPIISSAGKSTAQKSSGYKAGRSKASSPPIKHQSPPEHQNQSANINVYRKDGHEGKSSPDTSNKHTEVKEEKVEQAPKKTLNKIRSVAPNEQH